jgi:colicin import membrane protein
VSTAIQEYSKTDAALADLTQRFKGMVYDVATPTGMQEAKVARAEIRGYRVDLEKVRVEIKAPALERCRLIDAEAKRITAVLVELEDPIDNLIKTEERRKEREAMEAAMARQRAIDATRARIEQIRQVPASCVGKNAVEIGAILDITAAISIGTDFGDFRVEAEDAKRATIAQVSAMLCGVQAQEAEAERVKAEREELARLRAAQAERERASREAMEVEQRASRERIAAEEQAVRAARAAAEAERQAADVARRDLQRRESDLMDARSMLITFKSRFGHLDEFAGVVAAIDAVMPKKTRKAA